MPIRVLSLALAVGLALVALGPALEVNVWRAQQVRALLGSGDQRLALSVDLERAGRRDLVLEALRRVDDSDGGTASRRLIRRAIETEVGGGGQGVAIVFE